MGRDRIIETYIQRLRSWEEPLTADSLDTIAQEVGLEPDDLAAVQQKAQDHLERGRSYLEFSCLDEAIDELNQAMALDPLNLEGLQSLTYAYDQRYVKRKHASDKKQAIALAQRCLELDPNGEASVMLISTLEHKVNSRQRLIWLGLAALLVIVGAKPIMDMLAQRAEVEQLTQDAIADSQNADSQNLDTDSIESAETSTAADIPITFEQAGLSLDPRLSRLDNYEDASYYTLQGVLLNDSTQEIDALQLNIEYLDQAGDAIATDTKDVIAENDATVRPGDHHAIDLIQKTTPELATVRLNVITIDELPAPPSYDPAPLIPYTWEIQQPPQLDFDLTARSENVNIYDLTDSAYFNAEWAVTNTSDTAIRKLKLQIDFYNQQDDLFLSEEILAVYGSDAPMLPDEVRPVRVIKSIDKDYERYEVTVVEAE